jgi:hypothetical protein
MPIIFVYLLVQLKVLSNYQKKIISRKFQSLLIGMPPCHSMSLSQISNLLYSLPMTNHTIINAKKNSTCVNNPKALGKTLKF